ncbi:hypothetical protein HPB47_002852 [Ixodes persulcatus]|uniref:Uncharacterized protein n=1 Tax=Ixodes persulcatus TaxID=34615 RepID=A0AC60PK78_IXOPE|nr:hypothetical protein HPB47_002852 [Ixodes persulcatus]
MDGGCSRGTDDKMDTQSFGIPLLTPRNGVVEVEGEEITPEEFHSAGGCWMPVLLKARAEKKALSLTAGSQPNRPLGRNNGRDARARITKTPRPPKLPEDDAKIVFRLRGGLNVRKEDRVLVQRSIQRAAQLSSENAGHDAFRFNEDQNTLIVSTPALENAVKYGGVHSISLKGQTYEVVAYAIPPDDTIKGVIHGIPDEDSEQDVLNNLVTARNPNVLHARRMGRSKSAVVLFKGQKVPFWIMYGNVEYKCNLYKKKIEMATRARRRAASAAMAHPTGDTRCKQRFKTPYILKQRQWEKKKKEEESRLKEEDFPPSRSRRRSSSRQRISWAGVTDHKASEKKSKEAKTQNDKLDEILVMMRQLQEENKALRVMVEKTEKENVWLRTQLQQKSNETEKEPQKASPPAKRKMVVRPGQETVALDKAEAPLQQEVNKQVVELMCNPEWLTQLARHVEQLRTAQSATGRHILEKLGIRYERQTGEKIDVPRRVREKLAIPNLPRHMHPVHHVERRTARAKALRRLLEKEEGVYYTDAARYDRDAMAAAVVDKQGKIVASCSVRTTEPEVAEEVAIALALKLQDAKIVVSDSQMAIRQYAKGRISPVTLRVLATSDPSIESLTGGDRLVTFRDILDYYACERMRYPPAHPSLDKRQEVAWRRLQTGTYPSPAQLSRWYPDRYKGDCQLCGARATLHHIVWECSRILKKIPNQESWEALLLCTDLKVQEQVVRLAEDAAGVQGILAVA